MVDQILDAFADDLAADAAARHAPLQEEAEAAAGVGDGVAGDVGEAGVVGLVEGGEGEGSARCGVGAGGGAVGEEGGEGGDEGVGVAEGEGGVAFEGAAAVDAEGEGGGEVDEEEEEEDEGAEGGDGVGGQGAHGGDWVGLWTSGFAERRCKWRDGRECEGSVGDWNF